MVTIERYRFEGAAGGKTRVISAPERRLGRGPGLPVETAYFRLAFTLGGPARLRGAVSALSRYSLRVNGVPVGHGPCKGDRAQSYVDEFDLGPLLHQGLNVIACVVVSFPPEEALGVWGEEAERGVTNTGPWSVIGTASGPCLLFCGEAVEESGAVTDLTTGTAPWEVRNDDALTWIRGGTMVNCNEDVDAAALPWGWDEPRGAAGFVPALKRWGFDERSFGEFPPFAPFKRLIPLLYERERPLTAATPVAAPGKTRVSFAGGALTFPPGGAYSVDLDAGELVTAYVGLDASGGAGSVVTLTYAESYGGPYAGGRRGDRTDGAAFALGGSKDVFRPGGGAGETYEFFWFKTFRYLRLEVTTGGEALTLKPLTCRETGYPLEVSTTVSSPEVPWIEQLWDVSLRTLKRCMHETYEDCPYYEQLQYSFDTRLQMLFTYRVSGDTRLGRKTIDDFHRSQLPEGILLSRYPTNGPQVIPTFALSWLFMLMDYYEETGDTAILERYRPTAEAVIGWFRRKTGASGLVENLGYWDYTDWAPEWGDINGSVRASRHGPSTIQNFMYVTGLKTLARMVGLLGFPDLAAFYTARAGETLDVLRRTCYDSSRGLFREGPVFDREYTQHAQLWAVLAGAVTGADARALMERTLAAPDLILCTFPSQFYLFRALETAGLYEKTGPLWDSYRRLLPLNLSTLPETPYDTARSDCHAWSALLLHEYPAKILGVYPREPGFTVIGVKPQGLFLGHAAGRVHTPRGPVEVAWDYEDGRFSLRGVLPPGSEGTLTLPDGREERLGPGPFSREARVPSPASRAAS